jgi:hypothetical protein
MLELLLRIRHRIRRDQLVDVQAERLALLIQLRVLSVRRRVAAR